jgi:hypothetical protein
MLEIELPPIDLGDVSDQSRRVLPILFNHQREVVE